MASSSIKTLSMGGNTYSLEDTQARETLSGKVDKVSGRGLSEDNYTTAEKSKLAGIAAGATANTGTVTGVKMNGVTKGTSGVVDLGTVITEHQDISGKQNTLVSGTNIRTINGQSLLGSGNITIEGGGGGGDGLTSEQVVTIVQDELDDYMPKFHLAVCDSSSTSTAKTVTIPGVTSLYDGLAIYVKNNSVASASGVKLNVNSLGAKPIYRSNASATAITNHMAASGTYLLIYNSSRVSGGCWDLFVGYDANTTYANYSLGQGYGTCATAAATTAKVVTLSSYSLSTGGIVAVKFSNDVPASSTMNINSKGAKPIFYRGSAITANIIKAGDVATFIYDGTNYILLAVDRGVEQKTNLSEFVDDLGSSPTHTHNQYLTEHQTIKTINGQSLLGNGNITIEGGGGGGLTADQVTAIVQGEIQTPLSGKVDKVDGKGLSSNDYTTSEKNKLAGIAAGATANTGTVTGVKMNGVTKGTSGLVDLGTVITSHQDIKTVNGQSLVGIGNIDIVGGGGSGLTADEAVTFNKQEVPVDTNMGYYLNFEAGTGRNYAIMAIANGIGSLLLSLDSEIQCENYVLFDNSSNSEDVTVALQTLQCDGEDLNKMIIPDEGILVPAGKYVELSYVVILSDSTIGVVTCSQVLTE
ncbi:MAG: hypothetical protein MJZ87_05370 [Bacteroidales bacterium]|nr:hypothetical protein [Bacteroidales bacterium]